MKTDEEIAAGILDVYLKVDDCQSQTEESAYSAKCAIISVAMRLGVYPEFVALNAKLIMGDVEGEKP